MRFRDKVLAAFWNMRAGSRMVRKIVFGMMFVFAIVFCLLAIIQSYFHYTDDFNNKHAADCYYQTHIEKIDVSEHALDEVLKQGRALQEQYQAREASVLCELQPDSSKIQLEAGKTKLLLDKETYVIDSYPSYQRKIYQDIQWESSPIRLGMYREDFCVFADRITDAYGSGYLLGSYPKQPGEIMLDTYILQVYGIENIGEHLLGLPVSICLINGETEEIILKRVYANRNFSGRLACGAGK